MEYAEGFLPSATEDHGRIPRIGVYSAVARDTGHRILKAQFTAEVRVKYQIYAALHEEATSGWVWLATPPVQAHRLIKIKTPRDKKLRMTLYCEGRCLDRNFVDFYNSQRRTRKIDAENFGDVLVIGDWYREALRISGTAETVELEIEQQENPMWAALKVGSQHPDPTVRLANRLGLLGTWLGLLGLAGAVEEMVRSARQALAGDRWSLFAVGVWLLVFITGLVFGWGARGVERARKPLPGEDE